MSILDELVKDDISLPSPPSIAIRILEAVKKDDASFSELAQMLQRPMPRKMAGTS